MGTSRYDFDGLTFECRDDTSDWNTVSAIVLHDEYGLRPLWLDGQTVFDIGSHIGSLAVWAATRGARCVALEPIPENLSLVHANAKLNHVERYVHCVAGALGPEGGERQRIRYGGEDVAHAFIGNPNGNETSDREVWSQCWTITQLVKTFGAPHVVKLDCEGGEWHAFHDPALLDVPLIVGEWHPDGVHDQASVLSALNSTHRVTFSGPVTGPGGFRAEKRL